MSISRVLVLCALAVDLLSVRTAAQGKAAFDAVTAAGVSKPNPAAGAAKKADPVVKPVAAKSNPVLQNMVVKAANIADWAGTKAVPAAGPLVKAGEKMADGEGKLAAKLGEIAMNKQAPAEKAPAKKAPAPKGEKRRLAGASKANPSAGAAKKADPVVKPVAAKYNPVVQNMVAKAAKAAISVAAKTAGKIAMNKQAPAEKAPAKKAPAPKGEKRRLAG